MKSIVSWSGGKDSCYALMQAMQTGYQPVVLLNMLNEFGKISRSHGLPKSILQQQADALQLPIALNAASWQHYEEIFTNALHELKAAHAVESIIFGDIDLEEHKQWEEKVATVAKLRAVLPLWQKQRKPLVLEMIDAGIEAYIVSCNATLGFQFLGKKITKELIEEMEQLGIDACGENGEYHTLVTHCPLFSKTVDVNFGGKVQYNNYWFLEMR